jgi:hypothetical protein
MLEDGSGGAFDQTLFKGGFETLFWEMDAIVQIKH